MSAGDSETNETIKDSNKETTLTEEELKAAMTLSEITGNASRVSMAAETAKVVEKYQQLNMQLSEQVTRVSEKRADENEFEVSNLTGKLKEISDNFENISCGKELAADAQVLETVSKLTALNAQALQQATAGRTFNGKSFAKKLSLFVYGSANGSADNACYSNNNILTSWMKFAALNDSKIFKSVPPLSTLKPFLAPGEIYSRSKKERVKHEKEKNDAFRLEALTAETSQGKSADLTRQLDNVYGCLKQQLKRHGSDRMSFYQFCLHPTDFAHTVENIFYVSFLVKEARVKIIQSESGLPQIARVSAAEREMLHAEDRTKAKANQGIIAISFSYWKELVSLLHITEPAIKPL